MIRRKMGCLVLSGFMIFTIGCSSNNKDEKVELTSIIEN